MCIRDRGKTFWLCTTRNRCPHRTTGLPQSRTYLGSAAPATDANHRCRSGVFDEPTGCPNFDAAKAPRCHRGSHRRWCEAVVFAGSGRYENRHLQLRRAVGSRTVLASVSLVSCMQHHANHTGLSVYERKQSAISTKVISRDGQQETNNPGAVH